MSRPSKLILWRGRKHSGKTTAAGKLARRVRLEGFSVAGLLAPAIYKDKQLVGFGAVDLGQAERIALASQRVPANKKEKLVFTEAGLKLGKAALSLPAVRAAELVIVDEFGPLELA